MHAKKVSGRKQAFNTTKATAAVGDIAPAPRARSAANCDKRNQIFIRLLTSLVLLRTTKAAVPRSYNGSLTFENEYWVKDEIMRAQLRDIEDVFAPGICAGR